MPRFVCTSSGTPCSISQLTMSRALRVAAPIYVEEEVFPKAGKMEVAKEAEPVKPDDPEQLREWLQNIKPEDFEKYNKA